MQKQGNNCTYLGKGNKNLKMKIRIPKLYQQKASEGVSVEYFKKIK